MFSIMYGYKREKSINDRSKMLKKMVGEDQRLDKNSKIDLSRLPPCQDALMMHINRDNYRLSCYKKAHLPMIQKPKPFEQNQGWKINEETGHIEPKWTNGPVLPQSMIDIVATLDDDEAEDDVIELEVVEFDENDDAEEIL